MKKISLKNKPRVGDEQINTKARAVWKTLVRAYPDAHCALIYHSPWQLLVATILSAQCTDKRVNMVTPLLFKRFPDVAAFAEADISELEDLIRSTGFFRNKAKNIQASARRLQEFYRGKVPDMMSELLTLPGVARKTANVVLFNAFGKNEGVAVDTHVARTAKRIGLSQQTDPQKIEGDLLSIYPAKDLGMLGHYLIELGRDVCKARKPACADCKLKQICPSAFKV